MILVIVNFYVTYTFGLLETRWIRIISCTLLFSYVIFYSGFKWNLLSAAFILFLLSALLALQNEVLLIRKINLSVVIIAYLLLILHVLPLLKNLKTDHLQKGIFLVILGLNLFMLYTLADMEGGKIQDLTQLLLLSLRGLTIIGLGVLAVSYSNRYSNKDSIYFLMAVLGFIFSDICAFITFYLGVEEFTYADRLFYILGLSFFARYATTYRTERLSKVGELL